MTRLTAQAYTVAWLCALPLSELVVATAMLDQEHDSLSLSAHDDNSYTYGSINGHNIVIACMPPGQPGKVSASKLIQPLSQSFPNLKIHLFVGVGSGVPRIPPPDNPEDDVHLGDVVIGWAEKTGAPGVVQWDHGRDLDENFEPLGVLDKPDRRILSALGLVLRNRVLGRTRFSEHFEKLHNLAAFSHPGLEHDKLFKTTYHHVSGPNCSFCDISQLTERLPRVNQDLIFHQGTIVSGDSNMKDPQRRDKIGQLYHGALCFEMEAAGVMDDKRCLIIRGIADYADSHKDGSWENYAAGTAAAFAREFLFTIHPQAVDGIESAVSLSSIPIELTEDQKSCLQSLSFPEIDFRKNDVVDPIDKTCTWLLKHRVYLRWLREHRGLLWLKGKPGAGKSTLLRYVLKQQKAQDMLIIASHFFHGRGATIQRNLLGLFRSLLFQVLQDIPDSLSSCTALFKRKCDTQGKVKEQWEWQASELQDLFKKYLLDAIKTHSTSVQIFVDALDECGEETAIDLVDFFQRLMKELPHTKASIRVFFSCRNFPFVALENGLEIRVEHENGKDVKTYVCNKLERGIHDKTMSEKLQRSILERSLNVFQWVVIVVPQVILLYKRGHSLLSIQKVLHKIPTKLNDLYQELFQGIDNNEKPQSLQLMQWICFALRPLTLSELRFAIAVDAHTPHDSLSKCQAAEEYVDTDEQMEKRINDLSKGLAEVKEHDDKQVVQFVHQSVGDYLFQDGWNILTNKTVPEDVVGMAHFRLSRSCIRYMSMKDVFSSFSIQQGKWKFVLREFPFLKYAVTSWVAHAKVVEERHISQRDLLDTFNQPSEHHLKAWIQMYGGLEEVDADSNYLPREKQTLLHVASTHGFFDVVSAILDEDDTELNSKDFLGSTPLSLAACNGNESVLKLLLEKREILPDLADYSHRTPLYHTAESGHVEIVKLLLAQKDVPLNLADNSESTPLHIAAFKGHVEIVKLLLGQNDIAPDLADDSGSTPLSIAAREGHSEVVELLLARQDVDPNSIDDYYVTKGTPLFNAAMFGYVEVVKLLLTREDVNPNPADDEGYTPLHVTVFGHNDGKIEIVKLLLAHEKINPNLVNCEHKTPLYLAASQKKVEIVELLLAQKDIAPNLADYSESTPLHVAASHGLVEIIELFLAREDFIPNSTDDEDNTPLHLAISCGHVEVVKLLLAREDTDPNLGRTTPLHIATRGGHIEIVKLLLAQKDIAPDLTYKYERTPLSIAAREGHSDVVELLLAREDVNPNSTDDEDNTPLHLAISCGHVEVVKLLLAREDTDPKLGRTTPLHIATRGGHIEIVKLLLAQKDIAPDLTYKYERTPLQIAARGLVDVVELLLAREDVNPNSGHDRDDTPLHIATSCGHIEMVKLLLARKDTDPNLGRRHTPLHIAAGEGHVEIVKLLLAEKDIVPDLADKHERTPLRIAASHGHVEVVELLLARKDTNPNSADDQANTPLQMATGHGHVEVVKLLLARKDIVPNLGRQYTPLHNAAGGGHVEIVKLLLAEKDILPDLADKHGNTPLNLAAYRGHLEVFKSLLAREDVNPNSENHLKISPIHNAGMTGHVEIVQLLLARKDTDPNLGRAYTPLHLAADCGHAEIVNLLLARKDVKSNSTDYDQNTPLYRAVMNGHVEVVKLLLAREDTDPNIGPRYTPIHLAAICGRVKIAKLLLAEKDIVPDLADEHGNTPLNVAAICGNLEVFRLLLAREDVNPNSKNHQKIPPIHNARMYGHVEIVRSLLARKDVDPYLVNQTLGGMEMCSNARAR